ncbi:hypothetical protein, partial [Acinetobacter baumannii]|uniref:hypothetical protein n=1 Tax=Acinetobacter baumannii TaxID=470 RepID=UPI0020907491
DQQVQHIIGMPLQLLIIGMPRSIIFAISMQQCVNISRSMPFIGIILQCMASPCMEHSIMHFIGAMPIIGMPIPMPIVGIIAMQAW